MERAWQAVGISLCANSCLVVLILECMKLVDMFPYQRSYP